MEFQKVWTRLMPVAGTSQTKRAEMQCDTGEGFICVYPDADLKDAAFPADIPSSCSRVKTGRDAPKDVLSDAYLTST